MRNVPQNNPLQGEYMTSEEFVTIMLEKRKKKEIEDYVEEVLENMSEMEITGPCAEALEGKTLTYNVW